MDDHLIETARQSAQDGRLLQAIDCYERILTSDPHNAEALVNLPRLYHATWNLDAAIQAFRRLLAVQPTDPAAWHDLGSALFDRGAADESLAMLRKALELRPDVPQLHTSLAFALIALGKFEEGWKELEWRLVIPEWGLSRGFAQPQWDGSNIRGQKLLIHNEGGLGDAIQFVRYVPLLEKFGATLILECPPPLVRLFSQILGVEQIVAQGQPLPSFDFHIPSIALPRILGTTLQTIPATVPYLQAPKNSVELFRSRISIGGPPKVGLAWAGQAKPQDPRSRSLSAFAPLGLVQNVRFYSLQTGPEAAQERPRNLSMIDFTDQLTDMAHTAGLISQLDLVISVDTSVAHLAAAMGKPVWMLIPCRADPRWMTNRADSPWYPTMRLFRQTSPGDWATPVAALASELPRFATLEHK